MRFIRLVVFALGLSSCFSGISPLQRISDASREANLATRFGQVEVAMRHVDGSARPEFLARRAQWGKQIRVLEIETAGINIIDEEHSTVVIDVSWSSLEDSLLRTTQVIQNWDNKKAGWVLTRERRLSGEVGLFGEAMTQLMPPHPDVHRPSRTLGN